MVQVEGPGGGDKAGGGGGGEGGGGRMVSSQFLLMNHFFLALVHNSPEPGAMQDYKDYNSVVVDMGGGCAAGCSMCSPVNGCLACEAPYFLVLHREGARQTASCTKTCPKGFFKLNKKRNGFCSKCTMLGCEECLGPHYCSTCQHHYFNYFGKCIRETTGNSSTDPRKATTLTKTMTKEEEEEEEDEEASKDKEEEMMIQTIPPLQNTTTTTTTTITTTTTPSGRAQRPPHSGRGLRHCRRRRRRKKGKQGNREEVKKKGNRKKGRKGSRRECTRRDRRRRRRRKGRRRRRKNRRKNVTTTTTTTATITTTTIRPTTVVQEETKTRMVDLSLLGDEAQEGRKGGGKPLVPPTHVVDQKYLYNRPREMARYKNSKAYRRKKPEEAMVKKMRHLE